MEEQDTPQLHSPDQNIKQELKSMQLQISQVSKQIDDILKNKLSPSLNGTTPELKTKLNGKSFVSRSNSNGKEFKCRESLLTDLFKINHFQTIHNIFLSMLALFFLNAVLHDILDTGSIKLDFLLIQHAFGKFHLVVVTWVLMKLYVLGLYALFHTWAYSRVAQAPARAKELDRFARFGLATYVLGFLAFPVYIILQQSLPMVSSMVILSEQVRMAMKSYAFIRENISRAQSFKLHQDGDATSPCPEFSKFLYFLFAPTLLYRDHYPRTSHIKWGFVAANFLQVVLGLFYVYFIFQRTLVPLFQDFGQTPLTAKSFMLLVFGCIFPAALIYLIGFFAILHSWFNAFAEMLRFADREFYQDWWNMTSYSEYYRTWNIVVHEWLYYYIYKDFIRVFGSKRMAMHFVFFLSAVVHEYILAFSFKFFYPVLYVLFAIMGTMFILVTEKGTKTRGWNVFMWQTFFLGNALMCCLYCMEWYARINCPPVMVDSVKDYFIPRSWYCAAIQQ